MERTLILVKPDAFARGLTGEIVARFERKGLRIVALQYMTMSDQMARRHYAEHEGEQESGDPRTAAEANARRKAAAVRSPLTLGADTVVALDGDIYGKPVGEAQAREFLARLAGREHEVVGGIALAADGQVVSA